FLHLAVYAARPDVGGICRGHGPWLVAWGAGTSAVPLRHGLGLLAGAHVGVHDDPLLVSDPRRAAAAAASLGADRCLLLRGNGGFATGTGPAEASASLHALEERCRVALQATGDPVEPTLWRLREADTGVELARHTTWFSAQFDDREELSC
ncbi:MAG: class II aldolase/adducin family protein, partial [Propionicimonas sp.]|nr:class II aldolase/adducin family protein [Propionicimonas sp.]